MTNPGGNQQYWPPQHRPGTPPPGYSPPPAAGYPGAPGVPPTRTWPQPPYPQPGGAYPQPQHPYPGTGYQTPPPPPTRRRAPWIIGGVVLVAAAVAVAGFTMNSSSGTSTSQSSSGTTTTTTQTTTASDLYRVVPKTLLPTASEVQQATLQNQPAVAEPDLSVGPDLAVIPATCALADWTPSISAWGSAGSTASQLFTDGTKTSFSNSSTASVAVFSSTQAAKDSMSKVNDTLKNCTGTYQRPSTNAGQQPDTRQVSNVQQSGDTVTWTTSVIGAGAPWVCNKAYAIKRNVAATASSCGAAESDSSSRLVTLVLAKLH